MIDQRTRRTVLGSIASLTALAGCLGFGGPGPGNDFESIGVDGTTLTIRVADGSAISKVNVIAPDDSLAWERDLAAGARKVTIDIGLAYLPGTYRVVGLDGDTTVAETTIDIAPDIAITRVGVGANNLDEMPDIRGSGREDEALVHIENRGTGPEAIEKLLFLGGVPNPTNDLKEADDGSNVSGILDPESGGEYDSLTLPGGQSQTIYSNTLPFSFEGNGVKCKSTEQSLTFRVITVGRIGGNSSQERNVSYSSSESYDGCDISLDEAS